MPRHNVRQDVVKFLANKITVMCRRQISTDRFKKPQRRIHRVVFRSFASVRKAVREHALIHRSGKRSQNSACHRETLRRQRKPRQGDHRIAAPVAEPRIASDHRLVILSCHDKLVGGSSQRLRNLILRRGLHGDRFPAAHFCGAHVLHLRNVFPQCRCDQAAVALREIEVESTRAVQVLREI